MDSYKIVEVSNTVVELRIDRVVDKLSALLKLRSSNTLPNHQTIERFGFRKKSSVVRTSKVKVNQIVRESD